MRDDGRSTTTSVLRPAFVRLAVTTRGASAVDVGAAVDDGLAATVAVGGGLPTLLSRHTSASLTIRRTPRPR